MESRSERDEGRTGEWWWSTTEGGEERQGWWKGASKQQQRRGQVRTEERRVRRRASDFWSGGVPCVWRHGVGSASAGVTALPGLGRCGRGRRVGVLWWREAGTSCSGQRTCDGTLWYAHCSALSCSVARARARCVCVCVCVVCDVSVLWVCAFVLPCVVDWTDLAPCTDVVPIKLDVLVLVSTSMTTSAAAAALVCALQLQLDAALGRLASYAAAGSVAGTRVLATHHVPSVGTSSSWSLPITLLDVHTLRRVETSTAVSPLSLALDEASATAAARRLALHAAFGLPVDRPLLRLANAVWLPKGLTGDAQSPLREEGGIGGSVLANVHVGLPGSGLAGASVHAVQGPYMYYHYMQHGFDDKGWGCAYRSLQTLVSWFILNCACTAPVPSHRDIQELLHRIGDKPRSFVGSSKWIGSIEVGFVLENLLGVRIQLVMLVVLIVVATLCIAGVACVRWRLCGRVDNGWRSFRGVGVAVQVSSRFIQCPSGSDIVGKARQLAHHFDTQGTPVMMGGGSLAYTLLGVDYNNKSGEVRFLILDPHYCGVDDLAVVQTKSQSLEGYRAVPVMWRGPEAFVASSFYNICLPQRLSVEP